MRSVFTTFLLSALSLSAAETTPPALRLGETVRPTRYAVELTLDPAKPGFSGKMDIAVQLREPVSVIWLNSTGLTVQKAELETGGKTIAAKILPGGEDFV